MSDYPTFDETKIKQSSQQSAFITLIGAALIVGALGVSMWELYTLDQTITQKKAVVDSLAAEAEYAQRQIDVLRMNKDELEQSLKTITKEALTFKSQRFEQVLTRNTPLIASVHPRAMAMPVKDQVQEVDRPTYRFSLWLEMEAEVREQIRSVDYEFNHPTFREQQQRSQNRADGFRVGYTGWGCLSNVLITLTLRDGKEVTMDFNMCRALGWEQAK